MSSTTCIRIDGEKLKKLLDEKKLSRAEVSRRVGYSNSYITCAINRNIIRRYVTDMLDTLYGIKLSDYEFVVRNVDEAPAQDEQMPDEIWKKLHDCVYSAVYDAVKKALSEIKED